MADIINDNVFLVGGDGSSEPPLIFSSFPEAEGELLGQLRKSASKGCHCAFVDKITCVQIDSQATKETIYHGSMVPGRYKTTLHIVRDGKNNNGCKAKFIEKLLLSLDYINTKKLVEGENEQQSK